MEAWDVKYVMESYTKWYYQGNWNSTGSDSRKEDDNMDEDVIWENPKIDFYIWIFYLPAKYSA